MLSNTKIAQQYSKPHLKKDFAQVQEFFFLGKI